MVLGDLILRSQKGVGSIGVTVNRRTGGTGTVNRPSQLDGWTVGRFGGWSSIGQPAVRPVGRSAGSVIRVSVERSGRPVASPVGRSAGSVGWLGGPVSRFGRPVSRSG